MHKLLQRQLRRRLGAAAIPDEWRRFLEDVEAAYQQADSGRALLERSLELTSQELLQKNATLRSFFESAPFVVGVVELGDDDLKWLLMSRAASTMWGTPPEAMEGKWATELGIPREEVRSWLPQYREAERTGQPVQLAFEQQTPIGLRWRQYTVSKVAGTARQFCIIAEDTTEQHLAERALRDSEAAHRLMFENSPLPLYVFDAASFQFLAANSSCLSLYGYSLDEFLALRLPDLRSSTDIPMPLLGGDPDDWVGPARHRRKDGSLMEVEITSRALMFNGRRSRLVVVKDVTQQRQLEEQLRQSQKMEAVGRLAGGVAHDFNNLLSVILSYGQMLLEDRAPEDPARADLEEICKAGERAAALTRQLLMFSRQQVVQPEPLDLNELLTNTERMLRRVLGEDIEMSLRLQPGLAPVRADKSGIEQVVMNLVVNARDAMPQGGRLTIETSTVMLEADSVHAGSPARAGAYVLVAVTDSGIGMDRATQARIFEPFFTTKEKGRGTGLGLSTVFGIVQQSGGTIWVYSEPGLGTTFKIYLPVAAGAVAAARSPAAREGGGSETILLVEDEEQVRAVALGILRRRGYQVIEARNADEALKLCAARSGLIDLLLTDVVMPRMSGPELAAKLAQSRPQMKRLFMSGYTDDTVFRHGILEAEVAFVQKPITPEALLAKVREVLRMPLKAKAG